MPDSDHEIVDHAFLESLRTLVLRLRSRRQLQKKGSQQTTAAGHTREFKDHRSYVAGDDYRNIDWRLYARLERLFIRIFEEVQEFHVHIIVDCSRSMAAPYERKRVAALRLAVALAYVALAGQHRVSVMTLGERCERLLPPSKGQGHVHTLIKALEGIEFTEATDLTAALSGFRPGRDRRGMAFVISDLFGRDPGEATAALTQVGSWHVESHVVQVLDPREWEPDLEGEILLEDAETGERRRVFLGPRDREAYQQAVAAFLEEIQQVCVKRQVTWCRWDATAAFEDQFLDLIGRANALAGS